MSKITLNPLEDRIKELEDSLLLTRKRLKDTADILQDSIEGDVNSNTAIEIYDFLNLDFYEYIPTRNVTLTGYKK